MQISIKNTSTQYQKIGSGYPLILLHGWGGSWEVWSPLIPKLSEKYQLIIPDLPLFGSSTSGQVWDSEGYADWLNAFLDEVIPNQSRVLIGHSFGGKIATIQAATDTNNLTEGLVIIDASGLPEKLTEKEALTQKIASLIPRPVKKAVGSTLKKAILKKMNVATDYQNATPQQQAVLRKIVREDISSFLSDISIPSLVIWGEDDQTTPLEKGKLFAELLHSSSLQVIKKAGHYPFIDQPQKVLDALTIFTTKVLKKQQND